MAFWIALESLAGEDSKSKRDLPFDVKDCIECVKQKVVEDNKLKSQVINSIHEAYRPIPDVIAEYIKNILKIKDANKIEKIKAKIRKMQEDRSNMVHKGVFYIDMIRKHNEYLKHQLLEPLLKEKLDVAFNNFIDSWPSSELRESLRDDYLEIESIKQVLLKYPDGATIDKIEYALYALTRKLRRPKDLQAKLEKLIEMGEIRNRIVSDKEKFFLNS